MEFKCKKSKLDIQLCRKIKKTYVYPVAVVYEGCPKAFDAGIWWPKTRFGRPAATQCPKGSVGEYLSDLITAFPKNTAKVMAISIIYCKHCFFKAL